MKSEGGSVKHESGSAVTIADLHKVEELEKKIKSELEKLREKKDTMDQELETFSDLEGLKRKAEARKQQLHTEKQNLGRYRENIKYELQTLQSQFEAIQAQLYDNDTHNQVRYFSLLYYKNLPYSLTCLSYFVKVNKFGTKIAKLRAS